MKKSVLASLSFLCFLSVGIGQQEKSLAKSDLPEWGFPLRYYNLEASISYDVTNDDEAFYFVLYTDNEQAVQRLLFDGFKIAVDKKGRKSEDVNLTYQSEERPKAVKNTEPIDTSAASKDFQRVDMSTKIVENMKLSLLGFTDINTGKYALNDIKELSVNVVVDSMKTFLLECRIPFSALDYSLGNKDISIGILLPESTMKMHPSPSGERPGPPQSAGRPPQGAGSPPSGMGAPPSDMGGMPPMRAAEEIHGMSEVNIWKEYKPVATEK